MKTLREYMSEPWPGALPFSDFGSPLPSGARRVEVFAAFVAMDTGGFGFCDCCGKTGIVYDGMYGCCEACAECQSLGHCYDGEDRPENTICCHGERHERRTEGPVKE